MPKNNVIKFDNYFKLPNQGLRTYFGKVVQGNSQVFDTPFARGESTKDLLENWDRELVSLKHKWPSLYQFEVDLGKKVGPLSYQKPLKDRMVDIESYYEGILLPSKPILSSAVSATIKDWSPARGLQVRNQKKTVELMKKSTNSGSPYFTKRRNVVDETTPCDVDYSQEIVTQHLSHTTWNGCAVLGWRGQEGGPSVDDVKQRVVWMFPFAANIRELQVYQPLIESAQRFNIIPAWVSMDSVDKEITLLFDTKGKDDLVICTDFSKFDQHFNADLQNASRSILQAIFTPNAEFVEWLNRVFPIKYMIPLAYDWGKLRFGKHGMGSGSGGTNADETLAHRSLQYEAAILTRTASKPSFTMSGRRWDTKLS